MLEKDFQKPWIALACAPFSFPPLFPRQGVSDALLFLHKGQLVSSRSPWQCPLCLSCRPHPATCQRQKDICQRALCKLFPPGKSPTTPAASNSSQLEQKFNIPPTLLPSRSSHQVQQRHNDTWHRERLAASSLPSRTLLPATLQRITANCSEELPAQTPATKQTCLSTAVLSPGSKPTSPSWHHQLTK